MTVSDDGREGWARAKTEVIETFFCSVLMGQRTEYIIFAIDSMLQLLGLEI